MIWKDYLINCLKLRANQSWRGHQKPPPPGEIGLNEGCSHSRDMRKKTEK